MGLGNEGWGRIKKDLIAQGNVRRVFNLIKPGQKADFRNVIFDPRQGNSADIEIPGIFRLTGHEADGH